MDQAKIGSFLKALRSEKHLTQEQLAEQFYTSSRTISRWENGKNLPDISVLIELADFYGVDIREILDGERKTGNLDAEPKDTLTEMAAYVNDEKRKFIRSTIIDSASFWAAALLFWILFRTSGWLSDDEITGVLFGAAAYGLMVEYIKIEPDMKQTKIVKLVYLILSGAFYISSVLSFLDGIAPLGIFFLIFGTVFFFCCVKADAIIKARKGKE